MQETGIKSTVQHTPRFVFFDRHQFQAVILDWDGVLVDSGENYYRAYEMVLRELSNDVKPREIYMREGQPTPQLLAIPLDDRGISATGAQIRELVERRRECDAALGPREFVIGWFSQTGEQW